MVQVRELGSGRSEKLGGLGSKGLEEFGSRGRVGTGEIRGVNVGGLGFVTAPTLCYQGIEPEDL